MVYVSTIKLYSDGTGRTYHMPTVGRKPRICVMYILTLWHRVFPEQSPGNQQQANSQQQILFCYTTLQFTTEAHYVTASWNNSRLVNGGNAPRSCFGGVLFEFREGTCYPSCFHSFPQSVQKNDYFTAVSVHTLACSNNPSNSALFNHCSENIVIK